MFRSQSIIGYKRLDARTSGDMPNQVSEGLRRPPVKPSSVQMKDCLFGTRTFGPAPPGGDATRSMMASKGVRAAVPCRRPLLGSTITRMADIAVLSSALIRWVVDQVRFSSIVVFMGISPARSAFHEPR